VLTLHRFTADEMVWIADTLRLPNPLITMARYHTTPIESLGLLCAHLRSPEDQWSLSTKYMCLQSAISEITNETTTFINAQWGHLLIWDKHGILSSKALRRYADVLHRFGCPSLTVFGFLDCIIHQMCCPIEFQELAYTSYKKHHGMKFQGIVVPSSLIAHLIGPFVALCNDSHVLNESTLLADIEWHTIQPSSQEGDPPAARYFQLYGNSAYGVSPFLVSPYSGIGKLTRKQAAWNKAMGGVWISVEHGFSRVIQDWLYLNVFLKQRIWGNVCSLLYRVGVLLTNAHSCLVPNQTARRYDCMPPSLKEYFHV
jgi:hypothetical protein